MKRITVFWVYVVFGFTHLRSKQIFDFHPDNHKAEIGFHYIYLNKSIIYFQTIFIYSQF